MASRREFSSLATGAALLVLASRGDDRVGGGTAVLAPTLGDGQDYWEHLTFCCLQGLANRDRPRVFHFYPEKSNEGWYGRHPVPNERPFYQWIKHYDGVEFDEYDDPWETFDRLDSLPFDGYVVVDRANMASVNVAANYAALDDLLPITPEMEASGDLPDLAVNEDLRGRFDGMNRVETYQWVYRNQWSRANKARLCNLETPNDGESDPQVNFFFTSNRNRDATVADGSVFIDLSSAGRGEERELKGKFLGDMADLGIVYGWHTSRSSEVDHIRHLSEHGQLAIGASTYAANLSFHARYDPPGDPVGRFRTHVESTRETPKLENKIYLTFWVSDGDSLNFLLRRAQGGMWLREERGEIPIGWEIAPLLADLGPGILDFFAHTATENDHFVGGPSGVGYFYPGWAGEFGDDLEMYLSATRDAFSRIGITETTVMKPGSAFREENRTRGHYNDVLGSYLNGVMEGYVGGETDAILFDSGFLWAPTALPVGHHARGSVADMQRPLEGIARDRPERPLFVPVHLTAHSLTMMDAVELMDRLDSATFEAVGPNAFYTLGRRVGSHRFVTPAELGKYV